jgi:hypothetical protein
MQVTDLYSMLAHTIESSLQRNWERKNKINKIIAISVPLDNLLKASGYLCFYPGAGFL